MNIIKLYSVKGHIITKNLALSEFSLTKTISSLEKTTSSSFSSILFETNQSGTSFNARRQASTVLSHIY